MGWERTRETKDDCRMGPAGDKMGRSGEEPRVDSGA